MLKIENLSVSYSKEKKVLSHLDLEVDNGEIIGVLGMNGAGKTTLFNTIYGVISSPKGKITFNDKSITFKEISFLETTNFFYTYMRGSEYLDLLTDGKYRLNLNQIFELPLDDLVDTYSTGMKKKLAFWGIFESKNNLVILDEPFNGVDIESVECFYTLIQKMKKEGKTILISSHMIESLTRTCDRIAYLKNGSIQRIYKQDEFSILLEDIKLLIYEKVNKAFR